MSYPSSSGYTRYWSGFDSGSFKGGKQFEHSQSLHSQPPTKQEMPQCDSCQQVHLYLDIIQILSELFQFQLVDCWDLFQQQYIAIPDTMQQRLQRITR